MHSSPWHFLLTYIYRCSFYTLSLNLTLGESSVQPSSNCLPPRAEPGSSTSFPPSNPSGVHVSASGFATPHRFPSLLDQEHLLPSPTALNGRVWAYTVELMTLPCGAVLPPSWDCGSEVCGRDSRVQSSALLLRQQQLGWACSGSRRA